SPALYARSAAWRRHHPCGVEHAANASAITLVERRRRSCAGSPRTSSRVPTLHRAAATAQEDRMNQFRIMGVALAVLAACSTSSPPEPLHGTHVASISTWPSLPTSGTASYRFTYTPPD